MDVTDTHYHLGHLFMEYVQKNPNGICKIDAGTGKQETYGSILKRSIQLAKCLRRLGLQPGDVLCLSGRNHLDLHIPYYAALMNGLPIVGVDPLFKYDEVYNLVKLTEPKISFCEQEEYDTYTNVAQNLGLEMTIVTFGDGDNSMAKLLENEDMHIKEEFKPAIFDLEKVYAWLVSTSGTSGVPKVAIFKHKQLLKKAIHFMEIYNNYKQTPAGEGTKIALNMSSVQWISGYFNSLISPIYNITTVQTSSPATVGHVIDIINKYKPNMTVLSPSLFVYILKINKPCDLTCFDFIVVGGSKISKDSLIQLRGRLRKDAYLIEAYGQTESLGFVLSPNPDGPVGNCGKPVDEKIVKLIDPEAEQSISDPYVTGELWIKGDLFAGYYKNEEETLKCFSKDGWFKTGDLLYHDEDNNYYFVDRKKMLIKYRNSHVVPTELEEIISRHEGVYDVGVTSVPNSEDGEHPVAFVVRKPGSNVTAQEIKDIVANKLSDNKQLRGGVIFVDELPTTSTGKLARANLRKMASNLHGT